VGQPGGGVAWGWDSLGRGSLGRGSLGVGQPGAGAAGGVGIRVECGWDGVRVGLR